MVEAIVSEKNSYALESLGYALRTMSAKLEAKDLQPLAAKLMEAMASEKDSAALASLGDALATMSAKLEVKDLLPAAALSLRAFPFPGPIGRPEATSRLR